MLSIQPTPRSTSDTSKSKRYRRKSGGGISVGEDGGESGEESEDPLDGDASNYTENALSPTSFDTLQLDDVIVSSNEKIENPLSTININLNNSTGSAMKSKFMNSNPNEPSSLKSNDDNEDSAHAISMKISSLRLTDPLALVPSRSSAEILEKESWFRQTLETASILREKAIVNTVKFQSATEHSYENLCRQCEQIETQRITITESLKELQEEFEPLSVRFTANAQSFVRHARRLSLSDNAADVPHFFHLAAIDYYSNRPTKSIEASNENDKRLNSKSEMEIGGPSREESTGTGVPIVDIALLTRGHLRIIALSHATSLRSQKMVDKLQSLAKVRERNSNQLPLLTSTLERKQAERDELKEILQILQQRCGAEIEKWKSRRRREEKSELNAKAYKQRMMTEKLKQARKALISIQTPPRNQSPHAKDFTSSSTSFLPGLIRANSDGAILAPSVPPTALKLTGNLEEKQTPQRLLLPPSRSFTSAIMVPASYHQHFSHASSFQSSSHSHCERSRSLSSPAAGFSSRAPLATSTSFDFAYSIPASSSATVLSSGMRDESFSSSIANPQPSTLILTQSSNSITTTDRSRKEPKYFKFPATEPSTSVSPGLQSVSRTSATSTTAPTTLPNTHTAYKTPPKLSSSPASPSPSKSPNGSPIVSKWWKNLFSSKKSKSSDRSPRGEREASEKSTSTSSTSVFTPSRQSTTSVSYSQSPSVTSPPSSLRSPSSIYCIEEWRELDIVVQGLIDANYWHQTSWAAFERMLEEKKRWAWIQTIP